MKKKVGADIFIKESTPDEEDMVSASDGSKPLAITAGQKIVRLGELHADMLTKVEEAKVAITAWRNARDGMPYLYQPTIPAVMQYAPR